MNCYVSIDHYGVWIAVVMVAIQIGLKYFLHYLSILLVICNFSCYQGQELGKIREVPICCTRKHLEVWGKNDQKIYDISGPCIPCSCGGDVPFQVCNLKLSTLISKTFPTLISD